MVKFKSNVEISILIACKIKGIKMEGMTYEQRKSIMYYYDLCRIPKKALIAIALDLGIEEKELVEPIQ